MNDGKLPELKIMHDLRNENLSQKNSFRAYMDINGFLHTSN